MARRRRTPYQREALATRGRDLPNLRRIARSLQLPPVIPLQRPRVVPVEDRRLFHPTRLAARTVLDQPAVTRPARARTPLSIPDRVTFADARRVNICRKRAARRRAIFASGAGGRRGIRKRRLNEYSHIKCEGKR